MSRQGQARSPGIKFEVLKSSVSMNYLSKLKDTYHDDILKR